MILSAKFACLAMACFSAAAETLAQAQTAAPTTTDIIAQMTQAQAHNRDSAGPYILTRSYKLFGGESLLEPKSAVLAEIRVLPPSSKKYVIASATGSRWGETIVRKMLDREVAFAKNSTSSDITYDNYDFRLVRQDELDDQICYVFDLLPRRKSKDLLRGTIWVDANTYLPRRVAGAPAESPSWWMRDVRIVFVYGYVGTMWLQTSWEATANVKLLGPSTLVWRNVKYQIGEFGTGEPEEETNSSKRAQGVKRAQRQGEQSDVRAGDYR
jgi:hypothetical protein